MTDEWPTDAGRMSASHTPQPPGGRCHHQCYPSAAAATFKASPRPPSEDPIHLPAQAMAMDSIHHFGLFLLPSIPKPRGTRHKQGPRFVDERPRGQSRWLPAGTWMLSMASTRGLRCIMILVVQVSLPASFNKLRQPTTCKHRPRVTRPMLNAPVAMDLGHGIDKTHSHLKRKDAPPAPSSPAWPCPTDLCHTTPHSVADLGTYIAPVYRSWPGGDLAIWRRQMRFRCVCLALGLEGGDLPKLREYHARGAERARGKAWPFRSPARLWLPDQPEWTPGDNQK